jgi:hypothetical protein
MIGEDKLLMSMQLGPLNETERELQLQDWLVLARLLIEPTFFQPFEQTPEAFDLSIFKQQVANSLDKGESWFVIGDSTSEFSFRYANQQLVIKNIIDRALFEQKRELIEDYIQLKMGQNGVFAYLRAYDEFIFNNTEHIEQRQLFESAEAIEKYPKIKSMDDEIVVDCNQFPGYDLFYRGLCLTSCWEMYYSEAYYQIIPKPIFLEVQQVEEVHQLNEQVIRVRLYRDPFNWKERSNVLFQQYYRDQLGFDHIAWDNGIGLLKEPFVEYAYAENTIQSVQYQNEKMQPIQKKDASFFITRSYNVENQHSNERRIRGTLNAQAYFPWVDETRSQMMNYKVIDPTASLDDGVEAYDYYIREYLEINVEDPNYENYLTILRIYVPEEAFAAFPMEQLKERWKDITIRRLKKKNNTIKFDLKKGDNHLRVIFMDFKKLEQLTSQKI